MASLFDLLRDTMPIAAAEFASTWDGVEFDDLELADVLSVLRYLEPDESYQAIKPPIKEVDYKNNKLGPLQRIWSWKHDAADPAVISEVWCRVRDAGFISHKVFDSIEWGYESETHEYKKCVRVTLMSGQAVELPLEAKFIAAKWVVMDGAIQENQTDLWKLESRLDKGLVIAFVYEIDEHSLPQPWKPKPADLEGRDAARETSQGQQAKAPKQPPPSEPVPAESPYVFAAYVEQEPSAPVPETDPWGKRARKGDLMPRGHEVVVTGEIPSVQTAELGPGRILVVPSLATCRENSDFFPGDIFGMGRIYPHVMFMSSIPVLKMEASVRYNRPLRTTFADPFDGVPDAKPTCHAGFDASNGFISSLMVADANESGEELMGGGPAAIFIPENRPLPFWSYLFSYYLPNAHGAIGNETMRVIRTDRRWERSAYGLVTRDVEEGDSLYELLHKEPRQGEFDNMHMAPTMRVSGAVKAQVSSSEWFDFLLPRTDIDINDPGAQEALELADISMAPFCVHDCLHTHWRWSPNLTTTATLGWDENGPNAVAGAPLVPMNQDVSIWLRSESQMTYHVWIGREDGSVAEIPPGAWQVVMHHGSGYAVCTVDALKEMAARATVTSFHDGGSFWTDSQPITPVASHAALYWHLRYVLEVHEDVDDVTHWSHLRVRERTEVHSMRGARDL